MTSPGRSVRVHSAPVVSVDRLRKSYGSRPVLLDVSFTVRPGERLALTGPSGSGKTTLLNCIGGVDRPLSGAVYVSGFRLDRLDSAGLARLRREHVGTIFQFFHLLPTLTVSENVELPLQLLGVPARERQERVDRLLGRVGLQSRADALPVHLSGGEQQRVAIARALVHQPQLVLADEPTGNLDSVNGAKILGLLREMADESGPALILVTHSEEAAAICHRRLRLKDGRIVAEE